MKNSVNLTELKKYLKARSPDALIDDITELFQRFGEVKDYYHIKIYPEDHKQVIIKYKKIIENEFFPSRGFGKVRLSVVKKAIADYKKVCDRAEDLIDIMLFYVEQGVKFIRAYGDISEACYISMEGTYTKAIENIVKYNLKSFFQNRCHQIVRDTVNTGYGFGDMISETYHENF